MPITGLAQVGMSGLSKVQCCLVPRGAPTPKDTDLLAGADWRDAEILPPPVRWGGGLPEGRLPANTFRDRPGHGQSANLAAAQHYRPLGSFADRPPAREI